MQWKSSFRKCSSIQFKNTHVKFEHVCKYACIQLYLFYCAWQMTWGLHIQHLALQMICINGREFFYRGCANFLEKISWRESLEPSLHAWFRSCPKMHLPQHAAQESHWLVPASQDKWNGMSYLCSVAWNASMKQCWSWMLRHATYLGSNLTSTMHFMQLGWSNLDMWKNNPSGVDFSIHNATDFWKATSKAEKNRICQQLLERHYPDTCLVDDVKKLLKQEPKGDNWNPKKLKLAKSFSCKTHCTTSLGFIYQYVVLFGRFFPLVF